MTEYYFTAPTDDEKNATYGDTSFDEFKQLSDEEIQQQRLKLHDKFRDIRGDDPDFDEFCETVATFGRFCRWRKHGVPDRDMTKEEFSQHMQLYAAERRKRDPNYDEIPDRFAALTPRERYVARLAMLEAWQEGAVYDRQPVLFASEEDEAAFENLANKGVLVKRPCPPTVDFPHDTSYGYVLADDFADLLFAMRWPKDERGPNFDFLV